MPAFQKDFEPVALVDKVVQLQPDNVFKRVKAVEQVGEPGPIDVLTEDDSSSNSVAADSETSPIKIAELETGENEIAQVRIDVLSKMRLQLRQPKDEDRRLNIAGGTTELTMALPPQLREVYINRDKVPQFVVQNPNKYPLQKAIINASGFRLFLSSKDIPEGQVNKQPVVFPTATLSQITQGSGASSQAPTMTQSQSQSQSRRGGNGGVR